MRCVKDRVYWGVPADWGWLHVAAKTLQMNLHSFDTGCLPWFAHFERFEGMKIALNGARIVEHAFPSPLRAWQQQVKSAQKIFSIPYATISNLALVHSLCFDCRVVGPKNVLSPPINRLTRTISCTVDNCQGTKGCAAVLSDRKCSWFILLRPFLDSIK